MSQLDLAVAAGTTARHVSFCETGRSRPGRDLVLRLAEVLAVPIRERNDLLEAAGLAPVYAARPLDSPELAPVRRVLGQVLAAHEPYPAWVLGRGL
jgi:transcriptional regulator with XRE-family HTH domain